MCIRDSYYNVYEIAPYVMGATKITLSYEDITHLMNSEFVTLSNTIKAEMCIRDSCIIDESPEQMPVHEAHSLARQPENFGQQQQLSLIHIYIGKKSVKTSSYGKNQDTL